MKGLKKLALISAISAASFAAQAEMKSLDDATMGTLTGQAGVTIELETQVSIGEFRYTDEGTFAVSNITLGGANGALPGSTALLDDMYIDIDVEADGDAFISVHSISGAPIDWSLSFDSAELRGTSDSTVLFSGFSAIGYLAQLDIRVDTATDTLIADIGFSVENLNVNMDFLAVGIQGLTVHGTGWNNGTGSGLDRFSFAQITMGTKANRNGVTSLAVTIPNFAADIDIAAVNIGGTSIGSIALDDLVISNTSMVIYGH